MQPAHDTAGLLLQVGQKGDDVVPGPLLDLQNPRGIDSHRGLHPVRGAGGDPALLLHGPTNRELDLHPFLVARPVTPQGTHYIPSISFDHLLGITVGMN